MNNITNILNVVSTTLVGGVLIYSAYAYSKALNFGKETKKTKQCTK